MIAIVDYKAGNLTSVKKAFDHLGADAVVTSNPSEVSQAEKIVLPGVGHFAATNALNESGLREAMLDSIERQVPFLGFALACNGCWLQAKKRPTFTGSRSGRANAAASLPA